MNPIERSARGAAPQARRGPSVHARRITWFLAAHVLVVTGLFAVAVQVGRSAPPTPYPTDLAARSHRALPAPASAPLAPQRAEPASPWSGSAPDVAAPWHGAGLATARSE